MKVYNLTLRAQAGSSYNLGFYDNDVLAKKIADNINKSGILSNIAGDDKVKVEEITIASETKTPIRRVKKSLVKKVLGKSLENQPVVN